jgi:hypothetical protein
VLLGRQRALPGDGRHAAGGEVVAFHCGCGLGFMSSPNQRARHGIGVILRQRLNLSGRHPRARGITQISNSMTRPDGPTRVKRPPHTTSLSR